jgi:CysZ protein
MRALLPGQDRKQRPGFILGCRVVLEALRFIIRTPAIWPYAALPSLLLFAFFGFFGWISFVWLGPALAAHVSVPATWYGGLAATALRYAAAIAATAFGALLALAITPPLSSPALERLVLAQERELGVGDRKPLGFFAELSCGIRAQALAALFALPLLGALWLVDLLLPVATLVTVPLKFAIAALALSWNLFDYPLTLRGVPVRERFALVMRYRAMTLGFGVAFFLVFILPCCAVILLPLGVVAATRALWEIVEYDPQALPSLKR